MIEIVILCIFLLSAVYSDLRFGKIFNWQIAIGIAAGLCFRYFETGPPGIFYGIVTFLIPLVFVFPLFCIGTLGGGDVKLLAAAAIFLTPAQTVRFMGAAFLIGAIEALIKMIKERNFLERFRYLMSYIHDVFTENQWKLYEESKQQSADDSRKHKIHFALPVFVSALILIGGSF